MPPPRGRRRKSATRDGPDPIDLHVGTRIRLRRTLLGLSQTDLGTTIGLTFQQVQKYERGSNRVSASILHHIAGALDVPVSFFFDDLPEDMKLPPMGQEESLSRRESLELMRHYYSIPEDLRRQLYELIKVMARDGL